MTEGLSNIKHATRLFQDRWSKRNIFRLTLKRMRVRAGGGGGGVEFREGTPETG